MGTSRHIEVMANILSANDLQAEVNRKHFQKNNCLVLNMIGSPGAGKTTVLERTLKKLTNTYDIAVIEGDVFTNRDAERIAYFGVPVIQINTEGGCHLDSRMVERVLPSFEWDKLDLMIIENVGNLVCPADFDLGEDAKVVVISVAEGDDKPAKYPVVFRKAKVAIINKIDLLPFVESDLELMKRDILKINPDIQIFEISCRTEEGLDEWIQWLSKQVRNKRERL